MVKFLIIRFDSFGDVLLTTPVIRGIKEQLEESEVHFLTTDKHKDLLVNNPHLDKLFMLKENIQESIDELIIEEYDYIIDLQFNLVTTQIKQKIPAVSFAYDRINFKKWVMVNFKINNLPDLHLVERFLGTVELFDVVEDDKGLDFVIPTSDEIDPKTLHSAFEGKYMVVIVDEEQFTKQIPAEKLISLLNMGGVPVCFIGNHDKQNLTSQVESKLKVPFLNTIGKFNTSQMASCIKQSALVLTPETGLMQLAAAFNKPILSLWGNTISEFGRSPYKANEQSVIFEVKHLRCRPCTKKAYNKCPKGHFKCMNDIDNAAVLNRISEIIK